MAGSFIKMMTPPCCRLRLRFVGLVIGCLGKFIVGSLFVFNSFEGAIKKTFNYTEKELELQSSMLSIGMGFGFLPGMFYDRFGPAWTSVFGLVVSVTSYLLLWSTTKAIHFYSKNSWLMSVYFLTAGIGSIFTYMVSISTNLHNFKEKDRGKVSGLLNLFFCGSPLVFSQLYYHVLDDGDPKSASGFSRIMLLFAVMFGIIDVLCIFFLRLDTNNEEYERVGILTSDGRLDLDENCSDYEIDQDENRTNNYQSVESAMSDQNIDSPTSLSPPDFKIHERMPFKQLLKEADFYLLAVMFTIPAGVGVFTTNNITEFATALRLEQYNSYLVLIVPLMTSLLSAFVGLCSDRFKHVLSRDKFVLIGIAVCIVSIVLYICFAELLTLLVISTFTIGFSLAIIWSIIPVLMSDMFHVDNFGRNFGILLMCVSIVNFVLQVCFGALYDSNITTPGGIYCYGMQCIRPALGLCLTVSFISFAIGVVLIVRNHVTI